MVDFLKFMDSKIWKTIIKRQTLPKVTTEDEIKSLKPKSGWLKDEDEEAHGRSCALNTIYNGVNKNISRLINTFSSTKKFGKPFNLLMKAPPKFA